MIKDPTGITNAEIPNSVKHKIGRLLDSAPYTMVITIIILFSVFAWDIASGWLPSSADKIFEVLMTVTFALFILELILMIIAIDKWWRSWNFWICFVATAAMIFDIPWVSNAIFGTGIAGGSVVKNLRLIKVFRVLARVGRLIRVLKSLLVSRIKILLASIFRKQDVDAIIKEKTARQQITEASESKIWKVLENATTIGITSIISIIYIAGTLYISSLSPDRSLQGKFDVVSELPVNMQIQQAQKLSKSSPDLIYLQIGETVIHHDTDAEGTLRFDEIIEYTTPAGTIRIDNSAFTVRSAKVYVAFSGLIIFAIASMVIFLNWAIMRFSMELSGALKTLAQALDERDPYTRMHSYHVSVYSAHIAISLGLGKEDQKIARIAGELHDIGKIGVPENILRKGGKLTDDEYEIMKQHTIQGAKILNPLTDFDAVILGVRHHHEKLDGTGYPDRLKGNQIPRIAKILAVCDVWDALTTDRPYRKSLSFEEAQKIMFDKRDSELDSGVLDAFFEAFDDITAELVQAKAEEEEGRKQREEAAKTSILKDDT